MMLAECRHQKTDRRRKKKIGLRTFTTTSVLNKKQNAGQPSASGVINIKSFRKQEK